MAKLIVISWRDIPSQVIVKQGRETAKVPLSQRFQEAVDRAAMRAGRGSSDLYLAEWKRAHRAIAATTSTPKSPPKSPDWKRATPTPTSSD